MNPTLGSGQEEGRRISRVQGGLGVIVILGLVYVISLWGGEDVVVEAPETPAVAVEVVAVDLGELRPEIVAHAIVASGREAWLASEAGGRVVRSSSEVGTVISGGAEIVAFDPEPSQIASDRAAAALDLAELALENAKLEWARMTTLHGAGDIPDSGRDGARLALEEAEARYADALAGDRAARRSLDETVVRAPWPGTLAEVTVDPGAMVAPGHPVARLVDMSDLRVIAGLSAARASEVTIGDTVSVVVDGADSFPVVVDRVGVTPDPMSRTYRVEVAIGAVHAKIGQAAKLHLVKAPIRGPVIPLSAIIFRGDAAHAFVVEEGRAVRRALEVGVISAGRALVRGGLREGDSLITVGQSQVVDGDPVVMRESS